MSFLTYYPLTKSDCFRAAQPIEPNMIMIHSTGSNNKYIHRYVGPDDGKLGPNQYDNHWNRPGISKCCHGFIGALQDDTIACYQTLPLNINGWHCGGSANNFSIGFEICEGGDDAEYFQKVYEYAVSVATEICMRKGWDSTHITSHYEAAREGMASNHGDPATYFGKFGKSMFTFRADVDAKLKGDFSMYKLFIGNYETKQEAENFAKGLAALFGSAEIVGDDEPTPEPEPAPVEFKVGDAVKIQPGVDKFVGGESMSSWVKEAKLYIRQIEDSGKVYLVSTEPTKNVYTGRVWASDVIAY